jgi:hypothetical protein
MAVKLGTSNVTLKLGTQSVTGYLGSAIVTATVPGAPTIVSAFYGEPANVPATTQVEITAPESDGGSAITGYLFYFDEVLVEPTGIDQAGRWLFADDVFRLGQELKVSAVNAVGEGPKSAPVTVT